MSYIEILKQTRLIAILRGIKPSEVLEVTKVLVDSGIKMIEVPLNSPEPFESIKILVDYYKDSKDILIGAGTVCSPSDVQTLKEIGATLVISPNVDVNVIKKTNELNMISLPGFLTPSEAYTAINSGAHGIKLFPFKKFGIEYYNDIKVILPSGIPIIVVGGVDESNIEKYLSEGVKYFGMASSLYKPNMDLKTIKEKAEFFVKAIKDFNA